jgi:hypothetical protein
VASLCLPTRWLGLGQEADTLTRFAVIYVPQFSDPPSRLQRPRRASTGSAVRIALDYALLQSKARGAEVRSARLSSAASATASSMAWFAACSTCASFGCAASPNRVRRPCLDRLEHLFTAVRGSKASNLAQPALRKTLACQKKNAPDNGCVWGCWPAQVRATDPATMSELPRVRTLDGSPFRGYGRRRSMEAGLQIAEQRSSTSWTRTGCSIAERVAR